MGSMSLFGAHVGTASSVATISTPKSMVSHQHAMGEQGWGPMMSHRLSSSSDRQEEQNWSLTVRLRPSSSASAASASDL